jgi:hypothetical protein
MHMAFENFFRRDRDREDIERERQDWRSDDDWRERRGQRESARSFGSDDERDFERRGWREGSDYYGNRDDRYGRSSYRLGDRSTQDYGRERGYGGRDDRSRYGGSDWGNEGTSYGGEFSAGSYTRGDFGEGSDDRTTRGSFGSGGYGRDLDYGRRGALGYRGYGGMGGAETGSSAYGQGGMREGMSEHRGRGPRGYRRSDERIREDVCDLLTEDPYLDASNMEVQVKECEVTLTGSVASREDKRRAEDLIERISGVKDVHNQLRVASEQRTAGQQVTTGEGTQAGQTGQIARH